MSLPSSISMPWTPCEGGNTPNRYWLDYNLQAIQLRLYGGKLTFEVPANCTIEKMYFYAGDWNDYNEFDSGEFSDDLVWSGSAQKVVLTIDSSKPNTKLNKIAVMTKDTLTGISSVSEIPVETLRSFDLQGRAVKEAARGMIIEQVRMTNGQVKTIKRMRR